MTPTQPVRLRGLLVGAGAAAVVVLLGGWILRSSAFDLPVVAFFNGLHVGRTAVLGDAVYQALSPIPAIIGTLVILALIAVARRGLGTASTVGVTVAATWLGSAVIKILVDRPRPDAALLPHVSTLPTDPSYPSGHTAFVAALLLAGILAANSRGWRIAWCVIGGAVLLLLVFSVLSDGVHYPTDVLASLVWAAGIGPLVHVAWSRYVLPAVPVLRDRRTTIATS